MKHITIQNNLSERLRCISTHGTKHYHTIQVCSICYNKRHCIMHISHPFSVECKSGCLCYGSASHDDMISCHSFCHNVSSKIMARFRHDIERGDHILRLMYSTCVCVCTCVYICAYSTESWHKHDPYTHTLVQ